MNAAALECFRAIADAMQPGVTDWQWIGPHASQRMFGITEERAKGYAARHGGVARQMERVAANERRCACGRVTAFYMDSPAGGVQCLKCYSER